MSDRRRTYGLLSLLGSMRYLGFVRLASLRSDEPQSGTTSFIPPENGKGVLIIWLKGVFSVVDSTKLGYDECGFNIFSSGTHTISINSSYSYKYVINTITGKFTVSYNGSSTDYPDSKHGSCLIFEVEIAE